MNKKEEELLKILLPAFKVEAEEHVRNISSGLLELEKSPDTDKEKVIVETIYREAHSLKGASRAVNMSKIAEICQFVESIFSSWKHQKIGKSQKLFDTLHDTLEIIDKLLVSSEGKGLQQIPELIGQLETFLNDITINVGKSPKRELKPKTETQTQTLKTEETSKQSIPETKAKGPESLSRRKNDLQSGEKVVMSETIRISKAKLESILLQSEELLSIRLMTNQRALELRESVTMVNLWLKKWSNIESDIKSICNSKSIVRDGETSKLLEFIDWNHIHIKALEDNLKILAKTTENDHRLVSGMVNDLLDDVKEAMMLPFSSLLGMFPMMIRDISRKLEKEVDLVQKGGDVEIDRRILDEMKDPLIHLLRNCVDHGMETPEERKNLGKPARGTITIAISHVDGGKIEVLIVDDGKGIVLAKVKKKAVECGVVTAEDADKLSDKDILLLIFQSDVSTSPIITDLSGRGLGLAIVREKVEKLGGFVSVQSKQNVGTSFRIVLPSKLATFRGILVDTFGHEFVIPIVNVDCVARVKCNEIKTIENRETVLINERTLSFVRLNDVLGLQRKERDRDKNDFVQVLVLNVSGQSIAFGVDRILCEQEVLVKGLGKQLARVRNIANATVLGSGKVVAILNAQDLIKTAIMAGTSFVDPSGGPDIAADDEKKRTKSILIAEDSITSRMLLKNILESSGYRVRATVDGVDAYTALREEDFDMLVSDIEMPRMNGFDLTSRIRSDKKLSELPVVLVTSLSSPEDKERGVEAGADAYIVKSSFDQSNLLSIVKRLI